MRSRKTSKMMSNLHTFSNSLLIAPKICYDTAFKNEIINIDRNKIIFIDNIDDIGNIDKDIKNIYIDETQFIPNIISFINNINDTDVNIYCTILQKWYTGDNVEAYNAFTDEYILNNNSNVVIFNIDTVLCEVCKQRNAICSCKEVTDNLIEIDKNIYINKCELCMNKN